MSVNEELLLKELGDIKGDMGKLTGTMEVGFKSVEDRLDRHHRAMYGEGGVEKRLRDVETKQAVIKSKMIKTPALISAATAAILWLLSYIISIPDAVSHLFKR